MSLVWKEEIMTVVLQGVEGRVLAWELVDLPINNSVTLGKIFPLLVFYFSSNGRNSYDVL